MITWCKIGRWKMICLLLANLSICSCLEPNTPREIHTSFYHWQSDLHISPFEKKYLERLEVGEIYLRFFDLDWNAQNGVIPVGVLQVDKSLPSDLKVIPTVFITNRCFSHLKESELPDLIEKMATKISSQLKQLGHTEMDQIQIDCDWTRSTRYLYFRFLELLQAEFSNVKLSATIRLHQIKYKEETGVPPVSRGALMFYNMGDLEEMSTQNSIFDWNTAAAYLDQLPDYPLDLDLALPVFSWGVLFRDDKMIKLINNLREEDLRDSSRFEILEAPWVEVVKSTYLQGYYLYQGDRLRLEAVAPNALIEAASQLSEKIVTERLNLIYYHLDSTTLKHYSYAQFQTIKEALANP